RDHSEEYVLKVLTEEEPRIYQTNLKGQLIESAPSAQSYFYCRVDGRPRPTVAWYKNNKPLNTTLVSGIDLEEGGQKLFIRRLVASDSGRYECRVSNRLKTLMKFATLKVNTNEPIMGVGSIIGIVLFVIVGIVFVVLAIILGKKIRAERKQSREMGFITQNLLEHGALEMFNDDIPLDEQAELLPYEQCWEFPKERLKLGRTLGQGAFGRVVRAEAVGLEEGETSTTVAVKMLKERADFEQMKALVAELKIMIHLGKHLNIVNLLGAVTKNLDKGELMVIVEFCRCGNLREYLLARREYFVNQINPITGLIDNKVEIESEESEEPEVINDIIDNKVDVPKQDPRSYENLAQVSQVSTVNNYGYQMLPPKSS
ncbi:vascular endothelial growth factor receptor-like protein, partial [Leptotrombidium deliense]